MRVNIGSGTGLVPSGIKPLPEPLLTPIYVAIRRNWVTMCWHQWHNNHGGRNTGHLCRYKLKCDEKIDIIPNFPQIWVWPYNRTCKICISVSQYRNENVVIFTKFSSLIASEVVTDDHFRCSQWPKFRQIATFPFLGDDKTPWYRMYKFWIWNTQIKATESNLMTFFWY